MTLPAHARTEYDQRRQKSTARRFHASCMKTVALCMNWHMRRPKNLDENFRLRTRPDGIWEVAWTEISNPKRLPRRRSTQTRDGKEAERLFPQIVADAKQTKPPSWLDH
ncbi:MAG: hypothetical protein AAF667_11685 [Pseudomonadota bacterium]